MSSVGMPGYQETPIGWLPISWSVSTFGSLLAEKPEYGANASAANFDDGYVRYVRITDIDDAGGLIPSNSKYLPPEAAKDYLLSDNDIVIARTGNTVGKSLRYRSHMGPCAFAGYLIRFRVGPSLSPEFTAQYVRSDAYWSWVKSSVKVGAQPNINSQQYQSLLLPVPPLPEQQKIAAILTAVDDKLDVIARQIEATQTLKQGLMQTLFSRGVGTQDADGRWVPHAEFKDSELGEIPVGWTVAPLGELIEKLMDFRGRTPKKLGMDWGGGVIPALSANNVRMGYIDFDRECYLGSDELYAAWMVQGDTRKNDLVFTMEAPLGNVAVIPDDRKYILSQRVVLLRANQRVKHSYLFQYLRSDTFGKILEANSTGTTAKGIQQKRLVQLPVVVPPPEEQGRIADMLSAIDGKLGALQSKQSHHQTLKRGLMQKLLTGEWRVSLDASATGT